MIRDFAAHFMFQWIFCHICVLCRSQVCNCTLVLTVFNCGSVYVCVQRMSEETSCVKLYGEINSALGVGFNHVEGDGRAGKVC